MSLPDQNSGGRSLNGFIGDSTHSTVDFVFEFDPHSFVSPELNGSKNVFLDVGVRYYEQC